MKNILKQEVPFLMTFALAGLITISNIVLMEDMLTRRQVLGTSTNNRSEKSVKAKNVKEKNKTEKINTKVHITKVKNATLDMKQVAKIEKEKGNIEVGDEITKATEEISVAAVESIKPIEDVEKRPAWKKFLLGPDYKNLGQLRSNLVHTNNGIRKIEKAMEKVEEVPGDAVLQSRLVELKQERAKIMTVINQEDAGFSLFGWLSKLIFGYNTKEGEVVDESKPVEEVETSATTDSVGNIEPPEVVTMEPVIVNPEPEEAQL